MTVDALGKVTRVSGVTIDITELKEAEARRTLLVREVDHRARNALAIVQSIVRMTKSKSIDSAMFPRWKDGSRRCRPRMRCWRSRDGRAPASIVWSTKSSLRTAAATPERITVDGPAVFLKPETAQIIALVLHELATNAVKYGALSDAAGKVSLSWQCEQKQAQSAMGRNRRTAGQPADDQGVRNQGHHREHPAAAQRQRRRSIGGRMGWRSPCRFRSATPRLIRRSRRASGGRAAARVNGSEAAVKNGRVLLVEDEALVGMMMTDFLRDIGFHVVGPFGSVSEAINAIERRAASGCDP